MNINRIVFFYTNNFLVVDERSLTESGGHLMIGKLTRPCVVTSTDYTIPTVFKGIKKNALLLVDNTRLEYLVTAVATAVDGGYFTRCGVVLLLDIDGIAARVDQGMKHLPKLLSNPTARLVGVHRVSVGLPLPQRVDWLKLICYA